MLRSDEHPGQRLIDQDSSLDFSKRPRSFCSSLRKVNSSGRWGRRQQWAQRQAGRGWQAVCAGARGLGALPRMGT